MRRLDSPPPTVREHTVRPGEHLWAIAEQVVTAHAGAAPTHDEVALYWRRLIAINRDRLADPANPDLVFPGQRFELPDLRA
jgi:nucleoid-associated protein YgaU